MAGHKRPFGNLELTGSPNGVHVNSSYAPVPYAPSVNSDLSSTYAPTFSSFVPCSFPLNYGMFDAVCQSSALMIEPLPAFDHPVMAFQPDLDNDHMSGLSSYFSESSHFGQSNGQPADSHSPTMSQSLQPYGNRANKRRSITSLDGPSGSEYYIDSPYFQGVMTPTTTQSYEMVEMPSTDSNHNSSGMLTHENDLNGLEQNSGGMLTHENDLMGLEINLLSQPAYLGATDPFSRSPPGILLEGIDPTFGESAYVYNEYGNWQSSNGAQPWAPFSSHRSPSQDLMQSWDYIPIPMMSSSQQEMSPASRTYSSPKQKSVAGGTLSIRDTNEPTHARAMANELIDSSSSRDHATKVKRKPAGKRLGPVPEAKRTGIKKVRQARACWCCKMRKVMCNADTERDCPECTRYWQNKMNGPFLGKRICYRTTLEDLLPVFIPGFMTEHFKTPQIRALTDDIVKGWLERSTEVSLSLGFGPPLVVKEVHEFIPNGVVQIFPWKRKDPDVLDTIPTIPLGIPQEQFSDLERHLDRIIDDRDYLMDFANRILRSNGYSRSSQTFKAVLKWYYNWKDVRESMSPSAELLLRNAIKVIMIIQIFSRRLNIAHMPPQFDKFFNEAPYTSQNFDRHKQSPRLINLQVKAAFWSLQQNLLFKVLQSFGRELIHAEGWPICFAVSVIIAFLLEQMEEKSVRFYRRSKACKKVDRKSAKHSGSDEEIREYSAAAQSQIFDIVHVLLRCKSEKQTVFDRKSSKKISSMGSDLRKVIGDQTRKAAEVQQSQRRARGEGQTAGRLVSALLKLV